MVVFCSTIFSSLYGLQETPSVVVHAIADFCVCGLTFLLTIIIIAFWLLSENMNRNVTLNNLKKMKT